MIRKWMTKNLSGLQHSFDKRILDRVLPHQAATLQSHAACVRDLLNSIFRLSVYCVVAIGNLKIHIQN